MSCSCLTPCNCSLGGDECPCVDPGLETTGRALSVLDYAHCQRRLQNAPGILVNTLNGSGHGTIRWTSEPAVAYPLLEVDEGNAFSHIVAALGDTGIHRRLVPKSGATGFLKAVDGAWKLVNPEAEGEDPFTIPDPLTLTQLNATTINVTTPTVSGTPTFSGLITDTVTQTIGLNASNQLVKGSSPTISVARFFENTTLLSTASPNATAASATASVTFSNEIYDADGIASPTGSQGVKIDKTGTYRVEWFGSFNGRDTSAPNAGPDYTPGLWLYVNGALVSWGVTKSVVQNRFRGAPVMGSEVLALNANDILTIRLNGSTINTANLALSGVGMILTKFK